MKHGDRSEPLGSGRATPEMSEIGEAVETVEEAASCGSRRHRLQRWRYGSAVQAARAINVLGSRSPAGPDGRPARLAD